jgi:hypothetical protein
MVLARTDNVCRVQTILHPYSGAAGQPSPSIAGIAQKAPKPPSCVEDL